ncbi:MAG: 4Fe-4S single cluster domain-containing protein [Thermodesulfobacteriota bacterium]
MSNRETSHPLLNIAAVAKSTHALGPGTRAVIWVQGCRFHCPGCLAPEWIPFSPATRLTAKEVLEKLDMDIITGMTFSGGEPMEQAGGLATLARLARKKKDIDLICFTGYTYERLLKHPPNDGVPDLLAQVDVLIDGPFIQSRRASVGLRGSSNQRVIFLSPRLKEYDFECGPREIEITISDGEVGFIGIPLPSMMSAMDRVASAYERSVSR